MESKPAGVWLEDAGKLSPYFSSAVTTRIEAASAKAFKYKKLEDLIGRNMSYYTTEIGDYEGKKKVEIDAIIDAIGSVKPDTRVASATIEVSTCSGFLERGPNGKFSPVGDSEPAKKSLDDLIEVKAPRVPLKAEAYDPDARDGDGDGIVQENTPWERPAATRLMDAAGKLIERGKESSSRPSGIRVVDADGNDVDYTPTYERSRTGTIGAGRQVGESTSKPKKKPEPKKPVADKPTQETPEVKPKKPGSGSALSDHGAGTLKERGMRDVRAAAAPPPPPEPKKPEPEKPDAPKPDVPDVPEGEYRMSHQPSDDGPRAFDLTEDGGGDWSMPGDVYDNPNLYTGADATVRKETMEQLERVRGNPDGLVTVYRYAPEGREFEVGNWVSLSQTYARQHGESNPTPGGTVQSMQVPAKEVRFAGDDLAEFGWYPEPESVKPEKPSAPKSKKPKSRNVPYKKESYRETEEPNENGILQEGTIWERPQGTEFVDANGRPIRFFENRTKRQVLVDRSTGKPVDYVPTYERPDFVSPADRIEKRPLKEGDHPVMEFYEPGKSVKPEVIENRVQTSRASRTESIGKQLDLLKNDELDKALEVYKVSDRAALVNKLLDLSDDEMIADLDTIRAKPLHIAMPPSGLKAFLKSKRFKSQFEKPKVKRNAARATQGGYYSPEKRRGVEEELLGIPAGLPDELRPAYGFQMTKYEDDASMLPTTGFAADGYGAVVLRLKDSVRPRTTMSYGDSSDNKLPVISVDGDVQRDAKIASFGRESNAYDVKALEELASAVGKDPDELTSGMYAGSPSYSEIQVHGGFSLDDVEEVHFYLGDYSERGVPIIDINGRPYIYVNEERVGNPDKIREDILEALRQAGLSSVEDKK